MSEVSKQKTGAERWFTNKWGPPRFKITPDTPIEDIREAIQLRDALRPCCKKYEKDHFCELDAEEIVMELGDARFELEEIDREMLNPVSEEEIEKQVAIEEDFILRAIAYANNPNVHVTGGNGIPKPLTREEAVQRAEKTRELRRAEALDRTEVSIALPWRSQFTDGKGAHAVQFKLDEGPRAAVEHMLGKPKHEWKNLPSALRERIAELHAQTYGRRGQTITASCKVTLAHQVGTEGAESVIRSLEENALRWAGINAKSEERRLQQEREKQEKLEEWRRRQAELDGLTHEERVQRKREAREKRREQRARRAIARLEEALSRGRVIEPRGHCLMCGKALDDPISVAYGLGSQCRALIFKMLGREKVEEVLHAHGLGNKEGADA